MNDINVDLVGDAKEYLFSSQCHPSLFNDEDNIVSFSLLSKMDKDPLKQHINPYYLSYIYTFEDYRRKKFASKLIENIKKDLETTVFCTNDNNKDLFEKLGFNFSSFEKLYNSFPIYRFP